MPSKAPTKPTRPFNGIVPPPPPRRRRSAPVDDSPRRLPLRLYRGDDLQFAADDAGGDHNTRGGCATVLTFAACWVLWMAACVALIAIVAGGVRLKLFGAQAGDVMTYGLFLAGALFAVGWVWELIAAAVERIRRRSR